MSKQKGMLGIEGFDPREYAISANAMLGIRDSGKTYDATKAAEELFDAGIPFCAFDPIGVWHSMRIPGKGKGYPVVVAGGRHGDLPLTPANCGAIVRAAMESQISLVIDLFSRDLVKADWKRIVRECTEILLHENEEHGLRHIFLEEAAEFVPQRVQDGHVFAAVEKVVRMGGNSKLGVTLINQRSADINKSVLELCANVFVHRQKGKNTLLDLRKWFEMLELSDAEKEKIGSTLPNLKSGQCWALLHDFKKPILLQVPEKNSLHPDRRATFSAAETAKQKPVPADAFVEAMKAKLAPKPKVPPMKAGALRVVEKSSRPAIIEREIDQAIRNAREEAFASGWGAGWVAGWNVGEKDRRNADIATMREVAQRLLSVPANQPPTPPAPKAPRIAGVVQRQNSGTASGIADGQRYSGSIPGARSTQNVTNNIEAPLQKIVDAIAWWNVAGIETPTGAQVGFVARYKPSGGTWDTYRSRLRSAGFIEYVDGGRMALTQAGSGVANFPEAAPSRKEFHDRIFALLDKPLVKMLVAVLDQYPSSISNSDWGDAIGQAASGGTWDTYRSRLKTQGLITYPDRGQVRAADWLFPEGSK